MEVTRGFNVDPSLDVLSVSRCTCGKLIRYKDLESLLTVEYKNKYEIALEEALRHASEGTEPDGTNPLEIKFYRILRRYQGDELEKEYQRLLEKNPYERAFNELNYNVCCRGTVLGPELVPNRRNFNPEIESGRVDPFVEDEDVAGKYFGHMKRGRFLKPRREGDRWYADTASEQGLSSYEGKMVVEWVEVPVPLFARNILKKVNEKATSVILPVIPTTPDPWITRKAGDTDRPVLLAEEVRYLALLRAHPDFKDYANAYIKEHDQIDNERYTLAFPGPGETTMDKQKKLFVRTLQKKGIPRERIFAKLEKKLPDESKEALDSIIDLYNISRSDIRLSRLKATEAYLQEKGLTETDLSSLEEVEQKVREEWKKQLDDEWRIRQGRRIWSNLAEFA